MPVLVIVGAVLMTIALVCYVVGILTVVRRKCVKRKNFMTLAFASLCDLSGTICMICYKGSFLPADWHGWVGYLALLLMLVNLFVMFIHLSKDSISTKLRVYDICLLILWLFSYSLGFIKL